MEGIYRFAGRTVRIVSLYEDIHDLCRDYRCGDAPDLEIRTGPADIEEERRSMAAEDAVSGRPVPPRSDGYLESYAVHRLLAERLLADDILLFHASAVAVDGEAYLFAAKSGTGKSTHARYWRQYFGDRAVMINDDKPLLRITDSGVAACGTPWCGKHGLNHNVSAPVRAICLLERSGENFITPIAPREAFPVLYRQTYHQMDREGTVKVLSLVDKMARSVRLYRLGVNMSPEAVRTAYEGMNRGSL